MSKRRLIIFQAKERGRNIGAIKYLESSAKTGEGIQETFREVFQTILDMKSELKDAAKQKKERKRLTARLRH
jgi:hypothetical protein